MARHRKIVRIDLDADARASQADTGRQGGPRAHKRINDHRGGGFLHEVGHEFGRFFVRVALVALTADIRFPLAHAPTPEERILTADAGLGQPDMLITRIVAGILPRRFIPPPP
jgi:hypothetical protein